MASGKLKIDIRRQAIMEQLNREGIVQVAQLSERLGTTQATIRNDLDSLAAEGQLDRIQGGAVRKVKASEGWAGPSVSVGQGRRAIAEAVLSYINENFRSELTVDELADKVFLSKYHFMRLFKAQTGSTVYAYVRQKRLMNASRLIREGVPAQKAAAESGFGDYSAFHRAFKESFGTSPGKLKK